jgi:hypothetical protein
MMTTTTQQSSSPYDLGPTRIDMKSTLAVIGLMLLGCSVTAQITVVRGKTPPKASVKGNWYFDAVHHTAWTHLDLEWTELGIQNVTEMNGIGNILVIKSNLGYSLLGAYGEYLWAAPHLRVTDHLIMAWDSFMTNIYLPTGSQVHAANGLSMSCWPVYEPKDTVQGVPAFCFPDFAAANDSVDCDTLKNFGMFGTNGQWLIAPQYDAAFHFSDGVAEVVKNGERRKINEKGETIN